MNNCQFSTLPGEALLLITGPDTLTFLQGQTTCDTRELENSGSLPGVYCTPQGRVVCDFLLAPLGEETFALRMRRDIRASSSAVLGKYIVFSKADIEDDNDDWQVAGLWGEDAGAVIESIFGSRPNGQGQLLSGPGFAIVQRDEAGQRFECFADSSAADKLDELASAANVASEDDWRALDIAAGIARIEAPLVDELVPQTVNFDLTGHISFTKGCYTGQEVVARLHYRGKSKRRGFAVVAEDATGLVSGAELFSSTSSSSVGHVVNTASTGDGAQALVSATLDAAEAGLHVAAPDGPSLELLELPYALEPEED